MMADDDGYDDKRLFIKACIDGDFKTVCRLYNLIGCLIVSDGFAKAIANDRLEIVGYVMDRVPSFRIWALRYANTVETARFLIKKGATSRLETLACHGKVEACRALLESGTRVDGYSLGVACARLNLDLLALFISYGGDLFERTNGALLLYGENRAWVAQMCVAQLLFAKLPRCLHDVLRDMFRIYIR